MGLSSGWHLNLFIVAVCACVPKNDLLGSILVGFGLPAPECPETVSWDLFWVGLGPQLPLETVSWEFFLAGFGPQLPNARKRSLGNYFGLVWTPSPKIAGNGILGAFLAGFGPRLPND